jgi:hypothetical protein
MGRDQAQDPNDSTFLGLFGQLVMDLKA